MSSAAPAVEESIASGTGGSSARSLASVPGIGAYSAMVLLAEIGDIARFDSKRALASYAGLATVVRESASKKKRGGTTHQGSNTLRWIMLQVAQVACRYSPAVRNWYTKLRRRKAAQVARIAVARKLHCVAWALLRHGACFDEQVFARTDVWARPATGGDEKVESQNALPTFPPPRRRLRAVNKVFATVADKSSASSLILCPTLAIVRTTSDGATGTRISLCAQITNRSLSAILTQIPLEGCGSFHRRLTAQWSGGRGRGSESRKAARAHFGAIPYARKAIPKTLSWQRTALHEVFCPQ